MKVSKGPSRTPPDPPWDLWTPTRTLPDLPDPKTTPKAPPRPLGDLQYYKYLKQKTHRRPRRTSQNPFDWSFLLREGHEVCQ